LHTSVYMPGLIFIVQRLYIKMLEIKMGKIFRLIFLLRKYQLKLVALSDDNLCVGLWTDAYPVYVIRQGHGSVGFNSYFNIIPVKTFYQNIIHLQSRLASGADHEDLFSL